MYVLKVFVLAQFLIIAFFIMCYAIHNGFFSLDEF